MAFIQPPWTSINGLVLLIRPRCTLPFERRKYAREAHCRQRGFSRIDLGLYPNLKPAVNTGALMMQFHTGTADHSNINIALKNAANGLPTSAQLVIATVPAQANAEALVYGLRTLFPEAALHIATSCLGSMTQAGRIWVQARSHLRPLPMNLARMEALRARRLMVTSKPSVRHF